MRDVLRDISYEKYHYAEVSGVPGHVLTEIGETRTFTGDTPHPVIALRTYLFQAPSVDPFEVYADRVIVSITCSPDGWMSAQLPNLTEWDGRTFSVSSIALNDEGDPVQDGEGNWHWVVLRGTIREISQVGEYLTILVESDNDTEAHDAGRIRGKVVSSASPEDGEVLLFDSITDQWGPAVGGGGGDMLKASYATASATEVDTALNAERLGGSLPAAYDQAGEAAAAVGAHEDTYAHGNIPTAGEKAALPGTSGVPGVGNKYVTDGDARNSDARTPTAHAASHENGAADAIATIPTTDQKAALAGTSGAPGAGNKYVTDSDARNTDARTPTAHTHDGGDVSELRWTSVASLADGDYTGTTELIAFAETAAVGQVVYVAASGKAALAQADATTTLPVIGLVLETVDAAAVAAATPCLILISGLIRNDAWNWTVGGVSGQVYLSAASAGALVQTVPGSGSYLQALGEARSADVLHFAPDRTWAEVA